MKIQNNHKFIYNSLVIFLYKRLLQNKNFTITFKNNEETSGYLHYVDPHFKFLYIAPTADSSAEDKDIKIINIEDIKYFLCSADIAKKEDFGELFKTGNLLT